MASSRGLVAVVVALAGCGGSSGGARDSGVGADMSSADLGAGDGGGGDMAQPACITPTTPGTCAAPVMTNVPYCNLADTGCMDSAQPTQFVADAQYYEVNSPLWSDGAAKSRAFVLPATGKISVKSCGADATPTQLAQCLSPGGVPQGDAETGKWVFPVGTVMLKSFSFDGKVVETRLFMHVDGATAQLINNGSQWVGYTYAWNEAQTAATLVPNTRTTVQFATGAQTVTWNYPSRADCIACHANGVDTLGPDSAQMNRTVGSANQIDTLVAAGLFDDTAPVKPYPDATVEPYANAALGLTGPPAGATVDQEARSYLSANCGFCHRPDVNDQGFDLRWRLTLFQTKVCGLAATDGIPNDTTPYQDFAPGDHAGSALWVRMNIPVPDDDVHENANVGRMPPRSSFVVDAQATALIAAWIDGTASCPTQ